jgi:CheY-like chemotaxis protein
MKTILFADDNPLDLKYVSKVIEKLEPNDQIVKALDGTEALAKWRELRDSGQKVDLMFIDKHMGKFNGFETIAYLRKEGYRGPAYILTGDQNVKNNDPNNVTGIFYKPLNRHHIAEALMGPTHASEQSKHVNTDTLDSLISDLNTHIRKDEHNIGKKTIHFPCHYRPIGTLQDSTEAIIFNISKDYLTFFTKDAIYHQTKWTLKAPNPLNLDMDVLIMNHESYQNGYIYECSYLYIRRALI